MTYFSTQETAVVAAARVPPTERVAHCKCTTFSSLLENTKLSVGLLHACTHTHTHQHKTSCVTIDTHAFYAQSLTIHIVTPFLSAQTLNTREVFHSTNTSHPRTVSIGIHCHSRNTNCLFPALSKRHVVSAQSILAVHLRQL